MRRDLAVAAGAATTGVAAAEVAATTGVAAGGAAEAFEEASARAVAAAVRRVAVTAAHELDEKPDQAEREQDDEEDRPPRHLALRLGRGPAHVRAGALRELRHAELVADGVEDRDDRAGAIAGRPERVVDVAPDVVALGVGELAFEPVADSDGHLAVRPFGGRVQDHDAVVDVAAADAPGAHEALGEVHDLVTLERRDDHDRDLGGRRALVVEHLLLEAGLDVVGEHVRVVVDSLPRHARREVGVCRGGGGEEAGRGEEGRDQEALDGTHLFLDLPDPSISAAPRRRC